MNKLGLASISALLLSAGVAHAADAPRWDYVSASYQSIDVDGYGGRISGLGVSGSKLLGEDFFVAGSYSRVSDDVVVSSVKVDAEFNTFSLGLGYRFAVAPNTDIFGGVSYEDLEFKGSASGRSATISDNGYGLQLGVRSMVNEIIELAGAIKYVDIGNESETGFGVSGLYNFTESFSAGVGYNKADNVDSLSVSAFFFF